MFSLRPVKKLSATMTMFPRSMSLSTRCEPTKPAPPVTRTRRRVALGIGTGIDLATVPRPRGSDVEDVLKAVDDLTCEDPDDEESAVDFFTSISATSELIPDPMFDDDDEEEEEDEEDEESSSPPSSRIISRPLCVVNPVSPTGRDSYFDEEEEDPNAVVVAPPSMLAPVLAPPTPLTNAIATITITAHIARARILLLNAYRAMILPKIDVVVVPPGACVERPLTRAVPDVVALPPFPPSSRDPSEALLRSTSRWPSFVTMRGRRALAIAVGISFHFDRNSSCGKSSGKMAFYSTH